MPASSNSGWPSTTPARTFSPRELDDPGSTQEPAGDALLLARQAQPEVARCCVTHASWADAGVTFEERLVALADRLWNGKCEQALELAVIDEAAARRCQSRWDLFKTLDSVFEDIAAGGADRLLRSQQA